MDIATLSTCCHVFWRVHIAVTIITITLWVIEGTCRSISDKISDVEGYLEHVHRHHFKHLNGKLNDATIQAAMWHSPELMGIVSDLYSELKAAEDAWLTLRYSCA